MAEIKIEKKTPIWPWILLALAIIAILIYIFAFNDGDDDRSEEMITETTEQPVQTNTERAVFNNSSVADFVSYIKGDPDPMGLDHEYTNEALSRLISATNAMADEIGYDIQTDIDEVKTFADKITRDPFETTHANSIRSAADILARSLQNMQQRAFSGLASDSNDVNNAATAIKPGVLTLDQKGDVKNFFRESADLLEKMNNNSPEM